MPYNNCDISTSGPVLPQQFHVSDRFTDFSELPSKGYCRLVKAQRYGVWNVLKCQKAQYSSDKQYQEMLSKEFNLMVGLNHPNIVRTYRHEHIPELGECIVMEYVEGRTLSDFLKENPSQTQRKQVVHELLDAIAYFHKKQIVHQDLKPSNILITHDGNHVKIIDFGLSDSRAYAILKEPAYTKAYAAPEQLSGREIDNRTDLYAFGLILKQLFPKRYGRVIHKCLQPQKEKRFSSAETISEAIQHTDLKRKWLPLIAGSLLLLLGLVLFFVHLIILGNSTQKEAPNKQVAEQEDNNILIKEYQQAQTTSVEAPPSQQAKLKSGEMPIQQNMNAITEDDTQELLEQYIQKLNFEFDSIMRPFEKEFKEGTILYWERFHNHKTITLYKMSIHIQQRRQQLPQNKQASFKNYAGDLWNRYAAKYPYKDAKGNSLYPYYNNLHEEGKISDEEYARLREEDAKDVAKINRLSEQLRIETAKN